jgi:hypothetical protein
MISTEISSSRLADTMVCIQAHNDDFDISLSGIAREYKTVIIVTVTDVGKGHYLSAVEQGKIPDDGVVNKTWISPEEQKWTQDFHSLSLSNYRIRIMEERYNHYRYNSVRPDTRVPDAITYDADIGIQLEYIRQVSLEIANKLKDLNINDYDLFIHDPEIPEHLDHQFSGLIGSKVYRLLPSRRLFYYYVYTVMKLIGYRAINVEEHLDHKRELFSKVWENEFLPLRMWNKDPAGPDTYFRNELIETADPHLLRGVLIKRSPWYPILRLLRRIRILLGFK